MKKLLSLALAFSMTLGLSVSLAKPVQADELVDTQQPSAPAVESASKADEVSADQLEDVDWSQVPVEGNIDDPAFESETGGIVPFKVIGQDDRQEVDNTSQYPYSAVCKLLIAFDQNGTTKAYVGTGFLVSPDTVMTAAHCLFDHDSKLGWAKSIRVIPGAASGLEPFGAVSESRNLYVPKAWTTHQSTDYDFGLIKLSQPLGEKAGYLKLITFPDAFQKNLSLAGYPFYTGEDPDTLRQYTAIGAALSKQGARTLLHNIDASSGQSGSPIFNSNNEVGAIHTFGQTKAEGNGATMIDSYVLAFVNDHANLDAPVYRLYNPNSGEHFYTRNFDELTSLSRLGWHDEGLAWRSQNIGGIPVYRLYNPNAGDHHYTTDLNERDALVKAGWNAEDVAWYASSKEDRPVYRLYNPNAIAGAHHFTTNSVERDHLIRVGWRDEKIGFHAV